MYLPFVNPSTKKTRQQVVQFGGLNRTQNFRDGELADSVGLSAREWPCLAQRQGRAKQPVTVFSSVIDLFAWDKLVMCESGTLYYDGEKKGELSPWPKQFAAVNTKLCIFPDKKYLDLSSGSVELKDLEVDVLNQEGAKVTFRDKTITMEPDVVVDGTRYDGQVSRPRPSATYSGGSRFVKIYEKVQWDPQNKTWGTEGEQEVDLWQGAYHVHQVGHVAIAGQFELESIVGRYVLLAKTKMAGKYALNFREVETNSASNTYDVTYKDYEEYDETGVYGKIIRATTDEAPVGEENFNAYLVHLTVEVRDANLSNPKLEELFLPGDMVTISGCTVQEENNRDKLRVEAVEEHAITFALSAGELFTDGEETGAVDLCREVPSLDFICESGNRLVGVSNKDKTIYISALGDPRNFYDYRGLSVSSAYIPVASNGDFTGCIAYGGNVLIFKEDCIIRLMGDYDGNYATYTDQVAGLQAGSAASMVIINEVLYFKGRDGIYAYTGSTPRLISAALGEVVYKYAKAGTDGQRYYISMMREDTKTYELLVYDTRTGIWMKEEDRRIDAFANLGGEFYMASLEGLYRSGQGETDNETDSSDRAIAWEATFTPFDETSHERKYPSRLLLRFELGEGAWVEAELSRDGGPYQHIWTSHRPGPTAVIPIRPGRCDKYQLRLKGEGRCVIRSMAREFSLGGVR